MKGILGVGNDDVPTNNPKVPKQRNSIVAN